MASERSKTSSKANFAIKVVGSKAVLRKLPRREPYFKKFKNRALVHMLCQLTGANVRSGGLHRFANIKIC